MVTNDDVVGDLNEVIDLAASSDNGRAKRAAVDRHVGSNFHVIVHDHLPDLRDFEMGASIENVTETVGTNHRAGMNADPLAQDGFRVEDNAWEKVDVRAELAICANVNMALQNRVRSDACVVSHDTARTDMSRRIDLSGRSDHCGRVNSWSKHGLRKEQGNDLGERNARIGHTDQHLCAGWKGSADQDGGGRTLLGELKVNLVFGEGQITGYCRTSGSKARKNDGWVAQDLSPESSGDFCGSKWHERAMIRLTGLSPHRPLRVCRDARASLAPETPGRARYGIYEWDHLDSPFMQDGVPLAKHNNLRLPGFGNGRFYRGETHDRNPIPRLAQVRGSTIEDDLA